VPERGVWVLLVLVGPAGTATCRRAWKCSG